MHWAQSPGLLFRNQNWQLSAKELWGKFASGDERCSPPRKEEVKKRMFSREKKLCFVIAQGRDGSTLLQALLNSSQQCRIIGENLLVPSLASSVGTYHHRFSKRQRTGQNATEHRDHPWFGVHKISFNRVVREVRRLILREVLHSSRQYLFVGCKEIRWLDFPHSLLEMRLLFPNAHYIFLERDPVAMSQSGWWKDIDDSQGLIRSRQYLLQREAEKFRFSIQLSFEDLVQVDTTRGRIEEFLGLSFPQQTWEEVRSRKLSHRGGRPSWAVLLKGKRDDEINWRFLRS